MQWHEDNLQTLEDRRSSLQEEDPADYGKAAELKDALSLMIGWCPLVGDDPVMKNIRMRARDAIVVVRPQQVAGGVRLEIVLDLGRVVGGRPRIRTAVRYFYGIKHEGVRRLEIARLKTILASDGYRVPDRAFNFLISKIDVAEFFSRPDDIVRLRKFFSAAVLLRTAQVTRKSLVELVGNDDRWWISWKFFLSKVYQTIDAAIITLGAEEFGIRARDKITGRFSFAALVYYVTLCPLDDKQPDGSDAVRCASYVTEWSKQVVAERNEAFAASRPHRT